MRMLLAAALLALALPLHAVDFSGARNATRQISAPTQESSFCSGVMVAPGRMITAAHCTDGEMSVNGKPVRLLARSTQDDIALLEVQDDCPCAPIAMKSPAVDEPVIVVGYPLNASVRVAFLTEGRAEGEADGRLRLTASIAPGNSGGGVFALRSGRWELVGIAVSIARNCSGDMCHLFPNISYASPLDAIRKIL